MEHYSFGQLDDCSKILEKCPGLFTSSIFRNAFRSIPNGALVFYFLYERIDTWDPFIPEQP